jgi:DNA-binding transcriptional ArsR family regulator
MEKVFEALADENRRKLLDALYEKDGQRLGDLCARLDMTRQAASRHLATLERAGLVAVVWKGREKLHYLDPVPLRAVYHRWIRKFDEQKIDALTELKANLERSP